MKRAIGICLAVLPFMAGAEELSPDEVRSLIKRLEALREGSEERTEARYRAAHAAFAKAVRSDTATHDLYIDCMEKVHFEARHRESREFREWKRRHKEHSNSPALRRALRHQLSWLLLTLEAASNPEELEALGPKAMDCIGAIFDDAAKIQGEQERLRQDVLQSVFAAAYGIDRIDVGDWPGAPLQLGRIYEKLILPPLRRPDRGRSLREAWLKRIEYETALVEFGERQGGLSEGGTPLKTEPASARVERFLAGRRPQLIWEMERDLFMAGDQKNAALRMLAHIEKYISHEDSLRWIAEIEALAKGEPLPTPPGAEGDQEAAS